MLLVNVSLIAHTHEAYFITESVREEAFTLPPTDL